MRGRADRVVDPLIVRAAEVAVIALQFVVGRVVTVVQLPGQGIALPVSPGDAMVRISHRDVVLVDS